VGDIYVMMLA